MVFKKIQESGFKEIRVAKGQVRIDDTTLRDGEQTAGVVFANAEKIRLAKLLDQAGVDQIEVGIPAMRGDEKKTIKKIAKLGLNASILAWNRAVVEDLKHSVDCGVSAVAVSISASDIHIQRKLKKSREWVLESVKQSVDYAKKHDFYVSVNAEDASRADIEFLIEFAKTARDHGADRLRFCDTIGVLDPFMTHDAVKDLKDAVAIEVEMHTHNDFGMATANALAGVKAGASWVNTTVGGLGERAGNAALEEVVMAMRYLTEIEVGVRTEMLRELAVYVARASARKIPSWKAIVGKNVFAHESGIHADGVIKDPTTYEPFTPEEVGLERQLVVGKHSGSRSLVVKFKEYGIDLSEDEAQELLEDVRAHAVQLKRALFDKELMYIYKDRSQKKKRLEQSS